MGGRGSCGAWETGQEEREGEAQARPAAVGGGTADWRDIQDAEWTGVCDWRAMVGARLTGATHLPCPLYPLSGPSDATTGCPREAALAACWQPVYAWGLRPGWLSHSKDRDVGGQ